MAKNPFGRFGGGAARKTALALVQELPDFLRLLYRLFRDARVSAVDKGLVAAVAAYVIAPVDLIPDVFAVIGFVDDLFLLGLAVDRLLQRAGKDVLLDHWEGTEDGLFRLVGGLDQLGAALPAPVRRVLKGQVERYD